MNLLQYVSIAGPDTNTSIEELAKLAQEFPFVEWGVLYSVTAAGKNRYPTLDWCEKFFKTAMNGYKAVHLCGKPAFNQLLSDTLPDFVYRADRLQLNLNARSYSHSCDELQKLYDKALTLAPKVVLQYHEGTEFDIARWLTKLSPADRERVSVLVDGSGGAGIEIEKNKLIRPSCASKVMVGFAGGINESNVVAVIKHALLNEKEFWVDMESGPRVNNELSIPRVRATLAACAPFVVPHEAQALIKGEYLADYPAI